MEGSGVIPASEIPVFVDAAEEEEYASQSKLLQEFTKMSNIDKAWTFQSNSGSGSQVMFSISQPDLLANKKKKLILSSHISEQSNGSITIQWAPFPVEVTGANSMVPSPSGLKLLVIRNSESESPTKFQIWGASQLEKEIHIPQSIHGSVYADAWFEGISWNSDETLIAYVAEEPAPGRPTFTDLGYKKGVSTDKDHGSWRGQGDWIEDWGETYTGKRQPALFVINIDSGDVRAVEGTAKSLSVGQVVWAPSTEGLYQYLVFVGWPSDTRKLGIRNGYNRPCALYAVRAPFHESEAKVLPLRYNETQDTSPINLTQSISSALNPRFSLDGKILVFLSSRCSVDSGARSATQSLHKIVWPTDGKLSAKVLDVVPVVMCADDGCFPGLYCFSVLSKPWLSDGYTMILSSIWGSTQSILSVNVLSGNVSHISPSTSNFSWDVLALDKDNILAVCSSPVDPPQMKYGTLANEGWNWIDMSSPVSQCSTKVKSFLSSLQFSILKIPFRGVAETFTRGVSQPIEAIFVSSKSVKHDMRDPLIVMIHGGPHATSLSSFSKSLAYLSSLGYNLLIVNYRGSHGFGEEALQSLLGKIGSQDVNDVLTAVDHAIDLGLADPSKVLLLGGSHGGFLTTHLIGQAPDRFLAAAVRNPLCNIALMVGTSDIPDWCFAEALGREGITSFTEAPPPEILTLFHSKSPILQISKVKTPMLFLLGGKDRRVPMSNGLQYARALKEKGVPLKVLVFPDDMHGLDRPRSDFESFLNIGVWFKKYCK